MTEKEDGCPNIVEKKNNYKSSKRVRGKQHLKLRVGDTVDVGDGADWIGICKENWYMNPNFSQKKCGTMQLFKVSNLPQ